jgi:hypothetical protein
MAVSEPSALSHDTSSIGGREVAILAIEFVGIVNG